MPVRVEIYEPPMCCPSGLWGPEIDPALLDLSESILRLEKEFNGRVMVGRYALNHLAGKFTENHEVMDLIRSEGIGVLPITCINARRLKQGSYPSYQELVTAIRDAMLVEETTPHGERGSR